MGLKINKLIGTNKGITSESYVRIEKYGINKYTGRLTVGVALYQNQQIAESASLFEYPSSVYYYMEDPNQNFTSENINVNKTYSFPLSSSILISGSFVNIIDLSPLESGSVFHFAYPKLKNELEIVFGSGSVEDII